MFSAFYKIKSCHVRFVMGAGFVKAVNNYELSNVTIIEYVNMCTVALKNTTTHTNKPSHLSHTHKLLASEMRVG